jgi:hypothetical protein
LERLIRCLRLRIQKRLIRCSRFAVLSGSSADRGSQAVRTRAVRS